MEHLHKYVLMHVSGKVIDFAFSKLDSMRLSAYLWTYAHQISFNGMYFKFKSEWYHPDELELVKEDVE